MDDETQHELKTEIRDEYLTGKHEQARRLILLNEKISGRNDSEKIEATFRYDFKKESEKPKDNPERLKNDKIIEQYALGGLEKIYGKFSNVKTKEEAVKRIYGIIEEFALDCKIIEPKENIPAPEFDEDYA